MKFSQVEFLDEISCLKIVTSNHGTKVSIMHQENQESWSKTSRKFISTYDTNILDMFTFNTKGTNWLHWHNYLCMQEERCDWDMQDGNGWGGVEHLPILTGRHAHKPKTILQVICLLDAETICLFYKRP